MDEVPRIIVTLEELLLELSLGNLNLDRLVDLLLVAAFVVGIVLDGGGEEGVDEGGLSQARLAGNLEQWVSSWQEMKMPRGLTIMVKPAPRFATILWRWLGRLAMPIGEALSDAAGAMSGKERELVTGKGVSTRTTETELLTLESSGRGNGGSRPTSFEDALEKCSD
jgi:hypothetical protein